MDKVTVVCDLFMHRYVNFIQWEHERGGENAMRAVVFDPSTKTRYATHIRPLTAKERGEAEKIRGKGDD